MNLGLRIEQAVKDDLGWELAKKPQLVGLNKPNILCCGEHFAIVTCTADDRPYVEAMVEMVSDKADDNVKFIERQKGARVPAGKGFGDKVWRENFEHCGIEISFAKRPDESERAKLKSLGFRWSRIGGVWYLPLKKMGHDVAQYLASGNLKKLEGV